MSGTWLFTDGSVNTQTKIGYGACLIVTHKVRNHEEIEVKVKRFEPTSSTKLELQTLLWAFDQLQGMKEKISVYTDSQNIVGLIGRRDRLERNEYRSKNGQLLKNHSLYQAFYQRMDQLECEIIKVKGHKVAGEKDQHDQLFTLVDRAARKALREEALV